MSERSKRSVKEIVISYVEKQGVTGVLLAIVIYGAWQICLWAEPKLTEAFETHMKFVETVSVQTELNTEILKEQTEVLRTLQTILEEQSEYMKGLNIPSQR